MNSEKMDKNHENPSSCKKIFPLSQWSIMFESILVFSLIFTSSCPPIFIIRRFLYHNILSIFSLIFIIFILIGSLFIWSLLFLWLTGARILTFFFRAFRLLHLTYFVEEIFHIFHTFILDVSNFRAEENIQSLQNLFLKPSFSFP